MTDITTILDKLSWPGHAQDRRGTMVWTASTGEIDNPRGMSASVVVGHDVIRARVRLVDQGELEPHLDVSWQLAGDQAQLQKCVVIGIASVDEDKAITLFQDAVNRMGVRPDFQAFAVRRTPEVAAGTGSGPRIGQ